MTKLNRADLNIADIENITGWRGKELLDRGGEKIGKLQYVYVDSDTGEPVFGAVQGRPDR